MFDPGVDHCFGADGDFLIGSKRLALFLLLDVDSKRFIDIHGLVDEGFVVINHGLVMRTKQSKIWKTMP